ncbi:MAG: pimeloyl-ACP methyl ester carboxylesterase [Glaciecola sp.]
MKRKFVKWIGYLLIVGLLSGALVFYFLVPILMVEICHPKMGIVKDKQVKNYDLIASKIAGLPIEFYTKDSLLQSAYLTFSQTESTKGTIILVHGIRGSKEHFIGLSQWLAQNGYNAVLVDLRAHGQSEGRYCTFGVNEKIDLSLLIDKLIALEDGNHNSIGSVGSIGSIGIWGQSLGAAVALQTLSFDSRIKFGVIESTFSDFESISHDYLNYFMWYSHESMSKFLVHRAGELGKFKTELASPVIACKSIHQPILMAHGDSDKKINIKYGKGNFKALASNHKEFITVEGANHVSVWKTGGERYFEKVLGFIDRHAIQEE